MRLRYYIFCVLSMLCLLSCGCSNKSEDGENGTIRTMGNIELHFFCITEWNSCHAYGVEAYRKTWWGKREKVYIFGYKPEVAIFLNEQVQEGKLSCMGIEIYGITPEILFDEWAESFFFDRTKEDIFLPVFGVPEDLSTIHLIDNDSWQPQFYHYHWNNEHFEYNGIVNISL